MSREEMLAEVISLLRQAITLLTQYVLSEKDDET